MAGTITEDYGMTLGPSATEGMMNEQRRISGDSIAEWRSSEQVENGTASTSPPYWDTDDDYCGPKPVDLYGRFTWKIENFSTIKKRELRSNAFEVGGYKWYILIYPQGCDVCNHLSLFLCVANHDKLLPGWSHFAQFTIAVVNKDPKKSKYSDTLHRFWKKEHDWGWKRFMELPKVYDGFIVADTLIIKAQVQVIREKADRPFRCLDCQYRRELVRVYLSNVEQNCRCFLKEKIEELSNLVLDKVWWASFHAFWLGIDPNARRHISRDKTDAILKVIVKHFFIEKEVTSTLVMDSLYGGFKALELQSKSMKGRAKLVEIEELPAPMVYIDQNFFVLADDVIVLIQKVLSDSSHQPLPSKDDKCSPKRTKDGCSGDEFHKDSIERDERQLMELGRRTIEVFSLVHIFRNRIEVSYQEAVALKRQEELIREEEAAGQAESDLKSKHGVTEKEKRTKRKQAKQKRNGRKGKERGKDERCNPMQEILQQEAPTEERISGNCSAEQAELFAEKSDALEDVSDVTDIGDDISDLLQPDFDDQDSSTTNWDTDMSETRLRSEASGTDVQNGQIEKRSQSVTDDSSSTCSTDSVPSVLVSGSYKGSTFPKNNGIQTSPNRGKNQRNKEKADHLGLTNGGVNKQSETTLIGDQSNRVTGSKASLESEANRFSLKSVMRPPEKNVVNKEEAGTPQKKLPFKDQVDADTRSFPPGLGKKIATILQQPKQTVSITISTTAVEPASSKEKPSNSISKTGKVTAVASKLPPVTSTVQSEAQKQIIPMKTSNRHEANSSSRPSSAPTIPAPRATAPIVSTVQVVPILSRSASAAGRLGIDASSSAPSPSAPCYVPQSYRNAIIGKPVNARGSVSIDNAASSALRVAHSQSPSISPSSASMPPPQTPITKDLTSIQPGLTFGCLKPEAVHSQHLRRDDSYHVSSSATISSSSSRHRFGLLDNMEKLDIYGKLRKEQFVTEIASRVTPYVQGTVIEEFPHLDIINDLLDDDQHIGQTARGSHHAFNRQYSLPANLSTADMGSSGCSGRLDQPELYYEVGFRSSYGASNNTLQELRDGRFQQLDLSACANSRLDGLLRSNCTYGNIDLSMLRLGAVDGNRYGYQLQDYLARGGNGYLYRPHEP